MAITAAMVKELREKTGAGMMDCKKVLVETDGDMDKAIDVLREKGLAKAAKKSDRIAAEGLVEMVMASDNKKACIVEINSETDFVAKNEDFKTFVKDIANIVLNSTASNVEELLTLKYLDLNETVEEVLNSKIATIGEKISIRRFERFEALNGQVAGYIHGGGKIGVLVKLESNATGDEIVTLGKDIAMQSAAMNPKYVSRDQVDEEYINHEREILKQQALNEGKPLEIVEKMIIGRLNKQLKEVCLLDQSFVKNPDLTIAGLVKEVSNKVGSEIKLVDVIRYEVGEGMEKKEENFAEEVAKQLK